MSSFTGPTGPQGKRGFRGLEGLEGPTGPSFLPTIVTFDVPIPSYTLSPTATNIGTFTLATNSTYLVNITINILSNTLIPSTNFDIYLNNSPPSDSSPPNKNTIISSLNAASFNATNTVGINATSVINTGSNTVYYVYISSNNTIFVLDTITTGTKAIRL